MEKLQKGQNNKLISETYQTRIDYCRSKGVIIKTRKAGYEDAHNVYYRGVDLTPGSCWDYHSNALEFAEDYITNNNL